MKVNIINKKRFENGVDIKKEINLISLNCF